MTPSSSAAAAGRMFDVAGRAFVVTGAASGIGLAIAEVLAANGARVLLLDRDAQALAAVAQRLDAPARAVDVAHAGELQAAVAGFLASTGRVDGLFANAGISGGPGFGTAAGAATGRLQEQDPARWGDNLQVNLLGVLNTVQTVVPVMKRQGRGSIVITASIAGLQAEPFVSYAYAAAKGAVVQVMRQAALELAPHGVRVNAIAPGFIRTGIAGGRLHDPAVEAGLVRRIPLGRLGEPQEVQGLALLLASDAGSYLTGTVFPIDGGVLLGAAVPTPEPSATTP